MMRRINVYLDDDLWLSFRKRCLERRVSASKALTELLRQSLAETLPSHDDHAVPHKEKSSYGHYRPRKA